MLGVGYDLLGESNQAIACFNDALSITEAHDETMYRSYTLWAMGVAIMRRGELERASRLLKEALVLIRRVDDRRLRRCASRRSRGQRARSDSFNDPPYFWAPRRTSHIPSGVAHCCSPPSTNNTIDV